MVILIFKILDLDLLVICWSSDGIHLSRQHPRRHPRHFNKGLALESRVLQGKKEINKELISFLLKTCTKQSFQTLFQYQERKFTTISNKYGKYIK